ncbi:hypothetical protein F5B21DRAFT_514852 [Xylaria acuta]|nr:hypothetical protein F5B21DRAFT_514852 [Xylaria acuta]
MVPFRHRQIFVTRSRDSDHWPFGDAEEIVDSLPWTDHNSSFYDQRYAQSPTMEPLSENIVRSQLTSIFYERMAFSFLCTSQLQLGWCDAHLSSPVSFQALYDSGKAFAVERADCDDGIDVVRVKIDKALEFVLGLIRREREAIPYVGLAAETEDRQHLKACGKWVDSVMAHARNVGIDTNGLTWEAVRRAKVALNGEAFDEHQVSPP